MRQCLLREEYCRVEMKVKALYFSATGTTKKATEVVAGGMSSDYTLQNIGDHDFRPEDATFGSEDVLLAAVPSFGGRVPAFAAELYSKLAGNGAKAVLLCTYGNREFDDTLVELQDILTKAGFSVRGAIAAVAQHSLCPEVAEGRPTASDLAELATMANRLREACGGPDTPLTLPGNRPYRTSGGVPFHPFAGDKCVSCGVCAKKCPVYAIPADNPSSTDDAACITCMRCVAVCPTQARSLPEGAVDAVKGLLTQKGALSGPKTNTLFVP